MSDADLEAKFRSLTDGILSKAETGNLIRLCWDIGRLEDAAEVARASVPTAEAAAGKSWVTTEDTEHTEKS